MFYAYTLVTGYIAGRNANTKVAFKNYTPFKTCRTKIDDVFVDNTDYIYIEMHMYNFIEYSNNYSNTSGSLWQFKRDEINGNTNVTTDNFSSFKYKSNLIGDVAADGTAKGVIIAVPFKYLSNFWRSLETPLINCKVELELTWGEKCILASVETATTFKNNRHKAKLPSSHFIDRR